MNSGASYAQSCRPRVRLGDVARQAARRCQQPHRWHRRQRWDTRTAEADTQKMQAVAPSRATVRNTASKGNSCILVAYSPPQAASTMSRARRGGVGVGGETVAAAWPWWLRCAGTIWNVTRKVTNIRANPRHWGQPGEPNWCVRTPLGKLAAANTEKASSRELARSWPTMESRTFNQSQSR